VVKKVVEHLPLVTRAREEMREAYERWKKADGALATAIKEDETARGGDGGAGGSRSGKKRTRTGSGGNE
jgi:hypothetical protein